MKIKGWTILKEHSIDGCRIYSRQLLGSIPATLEFDEVKTKTVYQWRYWVTDGTIAKHWKITKKLMTEIEATQYFALTFDGIDYEKHAGPFEVDL